MQKRTVINTAALTLLLLLSSGATVLAAGENQITVMTWNVHTFNPPDFQGDSCLRPTFPEGFERFKEVIKRYNDSHARKIDVIALQEVKHAQMDYLAEQLRTAETPYIARFFKSKTCACNRPGDDFGNAIITRLTIDDGSRKDFLLPLPYPSPPRTCVDDGTEYDKLGGYSVQVPPGGQWVRVYTTHQRGMLKPYDVANGEAAWALIDTLWFDAQAPGQPRSILMGDFNAFPSSGPCLNYRPGYHMHAIITTGWPYHLIREFADAWIGHPDPNNICGYTAGSPPRARYDYIFVRKPGNVKIIFNVDDIKAIYPNTLGADLPNGMADHLPVVADLSF